MNSKNSHELIISKTDYNNLIQLIEHKQSDAAYALDEEISRAQLVDSKDLPTNRVAMNTIVTFRNADSEETKTVQLVYPQYADLQQMKISILSPVGSALIGLAIGGTIEWPVPQGKFRRLTVIGVQQVYGQ